MIKEINGRWTCTDCGYEWSAGISDDAVPEICECQLDDDDLDLEEYTIVNTNDGNESFTVKAKNASDAAHIALEEMGWFVAI